MELNSVRVLVLVLLDSVDEGREALVKSGAFGILLKRRSLKDCTLVATSRPYSLAYDLVSSFRNRIYLIGFNNRRLDEFLI